MFFQHFLFLDSLFPYPSTPSVDLLSRFWPFKLEYFCFQFPHFPAGRYELFDKAIPLLLYLFYEHIFRLVGYLQIPNLIFQFPDVAGFGIIRKWLVVRFRTARSVSESLIFSSFGLFFNNRQFHAQIDLILPNARFPLHSNHHEH